MTLSDVQRSIAVLEREVRDGETWHVARGRWVQLSFVPDGRFDPQKLVRLMDTAAESDCGVLKLPRPEKPLPVFLYPSAESLGAALHMNGSFNSGVSLGSWAVIISSPSASYQSLALSAAHELGHALVHESLGRFGAPFFAEGIAFYLQARFQMANWLPTPAPVEKTSLLALASGASRPIDFQQGARFFGYLMKVDRNDPTRVKFLLRELHAQRLNELRQVGTGTWQQRVEIAFTKVYGKRLEALDSSWRKNYLSS